jgi:cell division protein FtsB
LANSDGLIREIEKAEAQLSRLEAEREQARRHLADLRAQLTAV